MKELGSYHDARVLTPCCSYEYRARLPAGGKIVYTSESSL